VKVVLLALAISALAFAASNSTDPFAKIGQMVDNLLNSIDKFLQNLGLKKVQCGIVQKIPLWTARVISDIVYFPQPFEKVPYVLITLYNLDTRANISAWFVSDITTESFRYNIISTSKIKNTYTDLIYVAIEML